MESIISKNIPPGVVTNFSANATELLRHSLTGEGRFHWKSIMAPFALFDRDKVKRRSEVSDFDNFTRPNYNHVYVGLDPMRLIGCIKQAEKFMLPDDGETINDIKLCMKTCNEMEALMLPFEYVCLEFFGRDADLKVVLYCEQVYDSHKNKPYIFVMPFFGQRMTPNLSQYYGWTPSAYSLLFGVRRDKGVFRCGARFKHYDDSFTEKVYLQAATAVQNVLEDFLTCLSCQGFSCETFVPSKTQKKKRSREGELPFFDYHVLGIGINHLSFRESGERPTGLGTGRKQRYHSVRGHMRQYRSGKRTWIRPHFAGNPALGIINKDYSLK